MKMITKPRTLTFWRAITNGCGSFGAKVEEIKKHGVSGGRAIMLTKAISSPREWNHWMRTERLHEHNEKMRRRALGGSVTHGFRFIGG